MTSPSILLDAVRSELAEPQPRFDALACAMQELVGYKVLTLLKFDVESFRSVRIFSSEPSYPIGGIKQHPRHSAWSEHIVDRCIPFVAVTLEDVRRTFPDHAGIEAVGCGSTLSVPIVHRGQPKGTLNLWHVSGFYGSTSAGPVLPFTPLLIPICLREDMSTRTVPKSRSSGGG
jgi:hypothetical protein